jgi:DNA polymerase III subunit gamma/tau
MAENFVVSARKYRPVTFDSVVGQSHITTTLKNAIRTKHLAQAFLFCGPRGVGKTTSARILAKTINCQHLSEDVEPCSECESCVAFQNNASFNVHELDAASNNSVEDIRNLIDQVRYPPQTGKYKIYIIDEVHMLSQAAFNAFLKTLEEPPSYAIFILATTEKHKILPTILSRCQIFDFNRIQPRDIADHLQSIAGKEGITAEREALELIAQKADGGLRDALSMFDLNVTFSTDNVLRYGEVVENLHILDYEYYFRITDALLAGSIAQSFLIYDEILQKGFDGHLFTVGLLEHLRNLLVSKDPATVQLLEVSETAKNRYVEQSQQAPMGFLLSALSVGSQCDIHYKAAKNQRLHVELCLLKLAKLTDILDLNTLPDDGDGLKKKGVERNNENGVKATGENGSAVANEQQVATVSMSSEPTPTYQNGSNGYAPPRPAMSKLPSTAGLIPSILPTKGGTETVETVEEPIITKIPDQAVTLESLKTAWVQLIRHREQVSTSVSEQIILNRAFILEGFDIHLTLDNPLQEGILNEIKLDLLKFLRQNLQNRQLQLSWHVAANDAKRNPYTPQEKFNALAEKNPHLLDLQRALGLEVEF